MADLEAQGVIMIPLALFKFARYLNARMLPSVLVLLRLIGPSVKIFQMTILLELTFLLGQLHRVMFCSLGSIVLPVIIAVIPIAHIIL